MSFRDKPYVLSFVLSSWLVGSVGSALAKKTAGQVVGVLDGDTIEVLHDHATERVRLHGIDCPEKGQAFGKRAKQATSELLFKKNVELETYGRDKYKRTVAEVFLRDGTNANHVLVQNGYCWWYREYAPNDIALKQLEEAAKASKKGLWADPKPVPPWLYRRLQSGAYP
jgi:micrococcal nuclease